MGIYTSLMLLPFFSLLTGLGTISIIDISKRIRRVKNQKIYKKFVVLTVIVLLILSILFSIFMINLWRRPIAPADDTLWMSEENYDTALFFKEFGNDSNYISNDGIIEGRINAIIKDDLYLKLNLSRVRIERGNLLDLYYSDTLYIISSTDNAQNENIHSLSFENDYQRLIIILSQQNIEYAIEKNNIPKGSVRIGRQYYSSAFFESVFDEKYKIYDNGDISVLNVN
jgi:hypothetical protein